MMIKTHGIYEAVNHKKQSSTRQAGLTSRPLTFRQIFTSRVLLVFVIWARNQSALTQHKKAA